MTGNSFQHLDEHTVHHGHIWRLVTARYRAPDGTDFERDIVRSPGAVAVVPLRFDPEGTPYVVLVAQYRPPYERVVTEVPAGMRDKEGEDTADVARRELVEEAGLRAGRLDLLTEMYPSPGMTDSVTTIYLATDCTEVDDDRQGPEEEHMTVEAVALDEAVAMVERGEIHDAKTIVGLLLTARRVAVSDRDGE